jgi:hypothetical protein
MRGCWAPPPTMRGTPLSSAIQPATCSPPRLLQEAAARGLGDHGKRDYLLQHSQLKLNAELVAKHEDAWTEDDIRARTDALIARVANDLAQAERRATADWTRDPHDRADTRRDYRDR